MQINYKKEYLKVLDYLVSTSQSFKEIDKLEQTETTEVRNELMKQIIKTITTDENFKIINELRANYDY